MPLTRFSVPPLHTVTRSLAAVAMGREAPDLVITGAHLFSDQRATVVAKESTALKAAWTAAGCTLPYMGFNLIPLSVIPEIRITDQGLVTVPQMQILPLFEPR